ncbi:MAG: COX15/CtaA family protein [Chloroflexota bacterium]
MYLPAERLAALRRVHHQDGGATALRIYAALRWLAIIATMGMLVVLIQGTLVTNSGSAAGCGNTWPLCRGQIIPELSGVANAGTLIEFTHRAGVPIESTLILVLSAAAMWFWRGRREAWVLAPIMIVFLFLQAMLGGLAVMYPTSAEILAAHFGISLVAFASVLLTAAFVIEADGAERIRQVALPRRLRNLVWATIIYSYIVVYMGAYVRHVNASLSCLDWPLCNGAIIPRFVTGVAAQFTHRVGAGVLTILIVVLFLEARKSRTTRPDLYLGAGAALIFVLCQAITGGIVVLTRLAILSTLAHSFFVSLLFGTLAYMCMHTCPLPRRGVVGESTAPRSN